MMDLSVSIVNWNTRDLLDQCLESVFSTSDGVDIEVIVVDNASSDDSVQMIAAKYPNVRLIANSCNVGFAAANNQAYEASSGRFFMLLNPDTTVESKLAEVVHYLDANPTVGIVGCKCLNPDGTLQVNWYDYYPSIQWELPPQHIRYFFSRVLYRRSANDTFQTKWVGGQCMTVRRECIERAGLMDESYFMYTEETDWCYRIRKLGWDVCHWPGLTIVHLGGQSTRLVAPEMLVQLYRSKLLFIRRYFPLHAPLFKSLLVVRTAMLYLWLRIFGKSGDRSRAHRSTAGLLKEAMRF